MEKEKGKSSNIEGKDVRIRSDSLCNMEELQKRKRDRLENREDIAVAEIFRRSKKTARFPKGESEKREETESIEKEGGGRN